MRMRWEVRGGDRAEQREIVKPCGVEEAVDDGPLGRTAASGGRQRHRERAEREEQRAELADQRGGGEPALPGHSRRLSTHAYDTGGTASSSFSASLAIDTTLSPGSRSMIFTPWVARPMAR